MSFSYEKIYQSNTKTIISIFREGVNLSFRDVINLWRENQDFNLFYKDVVLMYGSKGCFWEHPRIDVLTLDAPYEVAIIKTSSFLNRKEDYSSFISKINTSERFIIFNNLSGSAKLLIPNPEEVQFSSSKDLVSFLTNADSVDVSLLFREIGNMVYYEVSRESEYRYLSTHGLGVLWLHIRLDKKPKYYHHQDYKFLS